MPGRPEISALVRCHTNAAAVQGIARHVAPWVDEVVVAADARMSEDELAVLSAAAPSSLLRVPFMPPAERAVGYLWSRCAGRWVLQLDGDELPSAALLGALRELAADPGVVGHLLPRAWLWPGLDTFLAERPWTPDVQLRLVRNDPALRSFPGYTHANLTAHGPRRIFEGIGIYHADLALNDVEGRARKAARYDAERPGMEMLGGPFNAAYYLPEQRPQAPATEPVPEADRGVLEAVFGSRVAAPPAAAPADPPPLASPAEVDAGWAQVPWRDEDYRVRIEVLDRDLGFAAGETREVLVAVENHGGRPLPWGEHEAPEIRLSYHWLDAGGGVLVADGLRTGLPGPVPPGERRAALVSVTAPGPGDHVLEVDLVHEHVRWFGQGARVPVSVR